VPIIKLVYTHYTGGLMSLTPFEIRLELLKMAKEMLDQEFHAKYSHEMQRFHFEAEDARLNGTQKPVIPGCPTYFDESEVIRKAKELNSFVSQTEKTRETTLNYKRYEAQ